jgi:hypothetical protein
MLTDILSVLLTFPIRCKVSAFTRIERKTGGNIEASGEGMNDPKIMMMGK